MPLWSVEAPREPMPQPHTRLAGRLRAGRGPWRQLGIRDIMDMIQNIISLLILPEPPPSIQSWKPG